MVALVKYDGYSDDEEEVDVNDLFKQIPGKLISIYSLDYIYCITKW